MKQYDIDWQDFLKRLPVWDQLTLKTRRILSELKSNQDVQIKVFGDDLPRLVKAEFLSPSAGRQRVRLNKKAGGFGRGIRAMGRYNILEDPSKPALREYILEVLTRNEQDALAPHSSYYYESSTDLVRSCRSVDWLLDFVAIGGIKEAKKWETSRRAPSYAYGKTSLTGPLLGSAPQMKAAQLMVRELMTLTEPVPIGNLAKRLKIRDPALLATAIAVGIRYLLLFPAMRLEDMTPVLTVWPAISERLNRPPAKRPKSVATDKTFGCALLMEDMTTVLVGAAGEAPRIRQSDYGLFAKARTLFESKLMSVPKWCLEVHECTLSKRLDAAVDHLKTLGFLLATGTVGRDYRLEPMPAGTAWLGMSAKERLKFILDEIKRNMPGTSKQDKASDGAASGVARDKVVSTMERALRIAIDSNDGYDDDYDDDDDGEFYFDDYDGSSSRSCGEQGGLTLLARTPDWVDCVDLDADLLPGAIAAFASLARQRFVPLARFLEYQMRHANPLAQPRADGRPIRLRIDWSLREPSAEEAEECWIALLVDLLYSRLLPLGCVEVGIQKKSNIRCIALTDVGRYLLGSAKDFEYGTKQDAEGHIFVQPNFDVVFLAPSPLNEAALARFAERTGSGTGTLFKITRKSIFAAAGSGMTAKATLETLAAISAKPVPDNVAREIQGWFDQCRRISIQPAVLIHCPDAATATKVLAVGGAKLTAISDTVVELTDSTGKSTLVRKLRQAGVFTDQSADPTSGYRPPRRKHRRWGR